MFRPSCAVHRHLDSVTVRLQNLPLDFADRNRIVDNKNTIFSLAAPPCRGRFAAENRPE